MTTKLERISELSKQHPEMKFNSIGHLINIEMLKECHYKMDGRKAVGIDGISKGSIRGIIISISITSNVPSG